MKDNLKILVTGANGFLASSFIKFINSYWNNIKIDVLIRDNSSLTDSIKNYVSDTYFWKEEKVDFPEKYFKDVDYIFHFATNFQRENNIELLTKMADDNILLGTYLLSLLDGNTKFINIASWTSYDKDGNYNPLNFYSLTKGLFEKIALSTYKNTVSIRMPDTYGPNDNRDKIYNLIRKGIVTTLNSPSNQEINMIHTEDMCRALIYIITNQEKFKRNIFDLYFKENTITLKQLSEYLDKKVEFGNKEIVPLVKMIHPVPGFKLYHNIKDIGEV